MKLDTNSMISNLFPGPQKARANGTPLHVKNDDEEGKTLTVSKKGKYVLLSQATQAIRQHFLFKKSDLLPVKCRDGYKI